MEEIKKVGILGCGTMGAGIAQVVAMAGYLTVAREPKADLLAKGMARIQKSLEKAVEKGKLDSAGKDKALSRLTAPSPWKR